MTKPCYTVFPFPGGIANTVYIHSEEVTDVTYVTGRVRVKVKAIGALTQDSLSTAAQPYTASTLPPATEITMGTVPGSETSQVGSSIAKLYITQN